MHQSELFREVCNINSGPPPEINLFNEKNNGLTLLKLIEKKLIKAAHDVSAGGIIVALAEMCLLGNIGVKIEPNSSNLSNIEYLFAEDQSRYLIEIDEKDQKSTFNILKENDIYHEVIGRTQINNLDLNKNFSINLKDLKKINTDWFIKYNEVQE